jgi:hypothetical protein
VLTQPFILETRMLLKLLLKLWLVERNQVVESNISEDLLSRVSQAVDIPLQKFHKSRGLAFIKEIDNACVDSDPSFDAVVISAASCSSNITPGAPRCHDALVHQDINSYLWLPQIEGWFTGSTTSSPGSQRVSKTMLSQMQFNIRIVSKATASDIRGQGDLTQTKGRRRSSRGRSVVLMGSKE